MNPAAFACVVLVLSAACSDSTPTAASARAGGSTQGTFSSGTVRLSYRLDMPPGEGPAPAVVFGHGSGQQTKHTCRFLADQFLQRGYATLCFDKRGVGESTGEYSGVGPTNSVRMFDDLSSDMAAGVAHLRAQPGIDGARIGLAGVSQAGWIIPLAAAKARAAFMVILSGPTVSVGEEIFYSNIVEFSSRPLAEAYEQLPTFKGDRGFDPRATLESLNVPGLWLLGGEDRSIPTPACVRILDELIAAGRPFARTVFEGRGHDLSGAPIWTEIDAFLQKRVGR